MLNTIKLYAVAASAAAGIALGGFSAWHVQSWRYGIQISDMQNVALHEKNQALESAKQERDRMEKTKDDAIAKAEKRATENKAMADRSSASVASMREQLSAAESNYSKASDEARIRHQSILSGIVESCTSEYQRLGFEAASLASDLEMMVEAWPK